MLQDAVPWGKFNWPHTHRVNLNMNCAGWGRSVVRTHGSSTSCTSGSCRSTRLPIFACSARTPQSQYSPPASPASHPLLLPCFLLLKCCFMSPGKQLDMKLSLFSVCLCVRDRQQHMCVCVCIWCVHKIFLNWSLQHKSNKIKSFLPGDKWQSHRRSRQRQQAARSSQKDAPCKLLSINLFTLKPCQRAVSRLPGPGRRNTKDLWQIAEILAAAQLEQLLQPERFNCLPDNLESTQSSVFVCVCVCEYAPPPLARCYQATGTMIWYQHLASYRPLENGIAAQTNRTEHTQHS